MAQGLVLALPCWERGGAPRDAVTRRSSTFYNGGPAWVTTGAGPGLSFSGAGGGSGVRLQAPAISTPTLPITFFLCVKPATSNPIGLFDTAPNQAHVMRNYPAGNFEWWSGDPLIACGLTANQVQHVAVQYSYDAGNRRIDWWRDGVFQGTATGSNNGYAWTTLEFGSINFGNDGNYNGVIIDAKVVAGRRMSDALVRWLHYDPWSVYRPHWWTPERLVVPFLAAASGRSIAQILRIPSIPRLARIPSV